MAKKNDTLKWVVILAGLGIGGYFLYNWLKTNPLGDLFKGATNTVQTIEKLVSVPGDIYNYTVTPGIPATPTSPGGTAPINYIIPPTGIPGFIDFAKTPLGGQGTATPSYGAFLFPPLGLIDAYNALTGKTTFAPPKTTVSAKTGLSVTPSQMVPTGVALSPVQKAIYNKIVETRFTTTPTTTTKAIPTIQETSAKLLSTFVGNNIADIQGYISNVSKIISPKTVSASTTTNKAITGTVTPVVKAPIIQGTGAYKKPGGM
jgi:hypothetical protein